MPILDNLKDVATLLGGKRGEAPIVQDQQLDARQALEQPGMTAVTACECEGIEQPWHAMVEDGAVVAAGLVAEWPSPQEISRSTWVDAMMGEGNHIIPDFGNRLTNMS